MKSLKKIYKAIKKIQGYKQQSLELLENTTKEKKRAKIYRNIKFFDESIDEILDIINIIKDNV
jgi:hypothetical protein